MTTPKLHLYIHTPVPIFKARVNLASATYPIASIPYDGVTLGAYTDISFDALLLLGTTEGADDLGRVRVSKLASATRIYIARSGKGIEDGTLTVQDNAYITILDDYPVYAKIPYFDLDNGIDYKDGDVPPGDFNTQIPPKANAGPAFADYIDPLTGLITVVLPEGATNSSFAMADGATLVTYDWDVKDGTITVGTNSDPVITVTFPAGFRWVVHTVTDSNGKSHTMRVPVLAVDPENDVTQKHYSVDQRFDLKGQSLNLELFDNLGRITYPDGTLVLFWWDSASSPSSRAHMKFVGWTHSESHTAARSKEGLKRGLTLQCVDATGRLALLPGFPQALEREESESLWSYMPGLDIRKSLYYLLFWHSTVLNVADLTLPSYLGDYDTMRLDANGGNLFDQVNLQANKVVPDHLFVCNSKGQLSVVKDWRLEDVGDRPASSPIITENEWNDLQVEYTRHPKVHVLRSAALLTSTSFIEIDGVTTLPLAFSIAPSDAEAFGQGTSEHTENEGLALTQAALNKSEGHRYAMLNSRYGPFRFSDPRNTSFWEYEPALMNRVQVNIPASIALFRGLNFTQVSGLVKDVNVQYRREKTGLNIKVSLTWEKEESGYPAITYNPEDVEDDVDYVPPPPLTPPDNGFFEGQELVAGIGIDGYMYRTFDFQTPASSGGPTWEKSSIFLPPSVYSWVVDPFSPGYAPGATSGAINGWAVNDTNIYRLTDIFGTYSYSSVHTFTWATRNSQKHWRTIQASFGAFFEEGNPWLMVTSYYGLSEEGAYGTIDYETHNGTWVTYSVDGGVTWSEEQQLSETHEIYHSALQPAPIATFLSPRTPGLAYTMAFVPFSSGPLPRFVHSDLGGANLVDRGLRASAARRVISSEPPTSTSVAGYLIVAPPSDTVRMKIVGGWLTRYESGPGATNLSSISLSDGIYTSMTHNLVHTVPAPGDDAVTVGYFEAEITKNAWPIWKFNRDNWSTESVSNGTKAEIYSDSQASGENPARCETYIEIGVIEIELEDGTIYNPMEMEGVSWASGDWGDTWAQSLEVALSSESLSGTIHIPWPDNYDESIIYSGQLQTLSDQRRFRLRQSNGDGTFTDISPVDTGIPYGVNRGHFGVRTFDSNRQHMLLAGVGNETSEDPVDDKYALFVSDDAGATWNLILGPLDNTYSPSGRPALEAAFSGDTEQVIFIWGPAAYIRYTSDKGATIDDRSGNLSALGSPAFVGIAGGPAV